MVRIELYDGSRCAEWDRMVQSSRNGTFLFMRGYMDYHAHRFNDFSLMAYGRRGKLIAILPAHIDGTTVSSHSGLTYGGWVIPRRHFYTDTMLEVWDAAASFLRHAGVRKLYYKPVPYIYASYPTDDDRYALFRSGAKWTASQASAAIPLCMPRLLNETASQHLRKAARAGVMVRLSDDFDSFWPLLEECLMERHSVRPVHSLEEMKLLHSRFPRSIRLFVAERDGRILAGTVVYFTSRVAHTQYIATTPEGRRGNLLPFLINEVIRQACGGLAYLDFGSSCTDGGRNLNAGLMLKKSALGGRTVCYDTFRLDL